MIPTFIIFELDDKTQKYRVMNDHGASLIHQDTYPWRPRKKKAIDEILFDCIGNGLLVSPLTDATNLSRSSSEQLGGFKIDGDDDNLDFGTQGHYSSLMDDKYLVFLFGDESDGDNWKETLLGLVPDAGEASSAESDREKRLATNEKIDKARAAFTLKKLYGQVTKTDGHGDNDGDQLDEFTTSNIHTTLVWSSANNTPMKIFKEVREEATKLGWHVINVLKEGGKDASAAINHLYNADVQSGIASSIVILGPVKKTATPAANKHKINPLRKNDGPRNRDRELLCRQDAETLMTSLKAANPRSCFPSEFPWVRVPCFPPCLRLFLSTTAA